MMAPHPDIQASAVGGEWRCCWCRGRRADPRILHRHASLAAVAETGTLVLHCPQTPHAQLCRKPRGRVRAFRLSAPEEVWDRLRAANPAALPRTVNMIIDPRTGDIEQRLNLGLTVPAAFTSC